MYLKFFNYHFYPLNIFKTSLAVASTLYQLSQNPEKQEKLHLELKNILPSTETKIDLSKLEKMSYLKACIKETLR